MPIGQRDVGTAGVVGPQQTGHDYEKVVEPPLPQCVPDGQVAVAFAKRFILHMGMCHAVVGSRRNRIECRDAIVPGVTVAQIVPGKLNLKPSQIDFFKFDGLGCYRNLPRLEINSNLRELFIQGSQIVINVTQVADRWGLSVIKDSLIHCLQSRPEFTDCNSQTITNSRGGRKPTSLACHIELPDESFTAFYLIGWHRH